MVRGVLRAQLKGCYMCHPYVRASDICTTNATGKAACPYTMVLNTMT